VVAVSELAGVDSSEGLGEQALTTTAIKSKVIHLHTLINNNLLSVLQTPLQQGGFHFRRRSPYIEISGFAGGCARQAASSRFEHPTFPCLYRQEHPHV
jgi:hypothetical protein